MTFAMKVFGSVPRVCPANVPLGWSLNTRVSALSQVVAPATM